MPYKFATENRDYSDLASGRVLYNLPRHPAFPVRLMSELFQRALTHLLQRQDLLVYDPCCGAGYHLTTLGYLHGEQIGQIVASDVDAAALAVAEQNLGLLSLKGLEKREQALQKLWADYGKNAHQEALQSVERLRGRLPHLAIIETQVFLANALDGDSVQHRLNGRVPDLLFADVPYGQQSEWVTLDAEQTPMDQFLTSMTDVVSAQTVVCIAADKKQKIRHDSYRRLERFQIGKRQIVFLQVLGV